MRDPYAVTLSATQVSAMLTAQGGVCACCREPITGEPHVDHYPGGAVVKALLCGPCKHDVGNYPRVKRYIEMSHSIN